MASDHITTVNEILEAKGNPLDICAVLYQEHLLTSEEPWKVLQQILQFDAHPIGSEDDDSPAIMTPEQETLIKRNYYRLAREITCALARENLPPDEFYEKLYHRIFASDLFPNDEKVKIVLLKILSEDAIEVPYFQAKELLSMGTEDFQAAVERVENHVTQALHMLNRRFDSRTVEASQLCRIASEIADKDDQVVYWAVVISILKGGVKQRENP